MEKAKKMLNGFGSFKLHLDREYFLTEDLYKQTWGEGTHWHHSWWGLNASGLVGLCLGPRLQVLSEWEELTSFGNCCG